ncbi:type VII secretion system-associated protein [Streptomyces sp. NPDC050848]|uniref:type VII secretion system-associated protein n=1 Tax=Streptomyces sp. NPDC050848 TaxID=3155791 RepID=UPI00340E4AF1
MAGDPNTDTTRIVMDKGGLQLFLDNRLAPFTQSLRNMLIDDPSGERALGTLASGDVPTELKDLGRPLTLGFMGTTGEMGDTGLKLNKALVKCIESITEIFDDHIILFDDMEDNMRITIKKLGEVQDGSLVRLDGEEFMDMWEDTVDDLASSERGGGGRGDDD